MIVFEFPEFIFTILNIPDINIDIHITYYNEGTLNIKDNCVKTETGQKPGSILKKPEVHRLFWTGSTYIRMHVDVGIIHEECNSACLGDCIEWDVYVKLMSFESFTRVQKLPSHQGCSEKYMHCQSYNLQNAATPLKTSKIRHTDDLKFILSKGT